MFWYAWRKLGFNYDCVIVLLYSNRLLPVFKNQTLWEGESRFVFAFVFNFVWCLYLDICILWHDLEDNRHELCKGIILPSQTPITLTFMKTKNITIALWNTNEKLHQLPEPICIRWIYFCLNILPNFKTFAARRSVRELFDKCSEVAGFNCARLCCRCRFLGVLLLLIHFHLPHLPS